MRKLKTLLMFLVALIIFFGCSKPYEKSKIPDFCQGDTHFGKLPYGGGPYCGPVSVSNALVYLDKINFPNLLSAENPNGFDEFKLIKLLGSTEYMNTMLREGTEPFDLMRGLEKFVTQKGYKIKIKWKGRYKGGNYSIGNIPDFKWLKDELEKNDFAILNIGWYKFDSRRNFYKRIGGHYVTVVGLLRDKLVIHDPAKRSGITPKDELCSFAKLESGKLSSWGDYNEDPAKGYSRLVGIKVREDADVGIVDGALVFKIDKKNIAKYFAYGSNLSYKRMSIERGIKVLHRSRAILKDHELRFNKIARNNPQEGKGNIVPAKGMIVEGILYDVSESDLRKLDGFEEYPISYGRDIVKVKLENGTEVNAFAYVAKPDQIKDGLKPTMEYLNYLLEGREFLSMSYYSWLKLQKTSD